MRRVAILGAAAADAAAFPDADEVIVFDSSVDELLAALERLRDPRCAFLLGQLPVLPLPDAWVDEVAGVTGDEPELARVRR